MGSDIALARSPLNIPEVVMWMQSHSMMLPIIVEKGFEEGARVEQHCRHEALQIKKRAIADSDFIPKTPN